MNFTEWLLLEETHKFSCVLVPLDKIAAKVLSWSKKHIQEKDLYVPEGGRDTETHVTALYGLHTTSSDDAKPIIEKFKPFDVTLGKISKFTTEKYDVIKIEVESSELRKMNAALKKLPYTSKYPKYVAHCTIAYVKPGSCDKLLGSKDFDGNKVKVDKVTFSASSGKKTSLKI